MRDPDPAFADARLAALYDAGEADRDDLDAYVALADEVGARSVVDLGCGTGVLALLLADRGLAVTGVDPAGASLDVARAKAGADRVAWVHGDATALAPGLDADLVVMTGNVAQVFVDDDDWAATLAAVRRCLRPGGVLAFETRRPQARAWEDWDVPPTRLDLPGAGTAVVERVVTEVALPLVTFTSTTTFDDGGRIDSASTLRFRSRSEVETDLRRHGYDVLDVREAPDRPGLELVFVARASG